MNLGIDFDDTYSADPAFWDRVIALAQECGHQVYCVTCRRDTLENRETVNIPSLQWNDHYFTGMSAKRWFMEQRGIQIDVWIDDMPKCVDSGR